MGRGAHRAAAAFGLLVTLAGFAHAQSTPPQSVPTVTPPLLLSPSHALLPPVPQLRLSWPITPLQFSFTGAEETGYASGPLRLFRFESLWLRTPALQLLTATSAERAFELDCRSTCQPVVAHTVDLEARVPLPASTDHVPSTYAFVRSSALYTSQNPHAASLLKAGIGGFLNF